MLHNFGCESFGNLVACLRNTPDIKVRRSAFKAAFKTEFVRWLDDKDPNPKHDFFLHRTMADVEAVLLGVFGDVTNESVGEGFGSNFGKEALLCTKFQDEYNSMFKSSGKAAMIKLPAKKDMLQFLHKALLAKLLTLPEEELSIMGWMKKDQQIYSIETLRCFSLTDMEHVCCKLYICAMMAHPSRNGIGKRKIPLFRHCWPLFEDQQWSSSLVEFLKQNWDTFDHIRDDNLQPPEDLSWPAKELVCYADDKQVGYDSLVKALAPRVSNDSSDNLGNGDDDEDDNTVLDDGNNADGDIEFDEDDFIVAEV